MFLSRKNIKVVRWRDTCTTTDRQKNRTHRTSVTWSHSCLKDEGPSWFRIPKSRSLSWKMEKYLESSLRPSPAEICPTGPTLILPHPTESHLTKWSWADHYAPSYGSAGSFTLFAYPSECSTWPGLRTIWRKILAVDWLRMRRATVHSKCKWQRLTTVLVKGILTHGEQYTKTLNRRTTITD